MATTRSRNRTAGVDGLARAISIGRAFLNNDIDGHAVHNARELHVLVKSMI
jgi:hypothetical protein